MEAKEKMFEYDKPYVIAEIVCNLLWKHLWGAQRVFRVFSGTT